MNSEIQPSQAITWLVAFMVTGAIVGILVTPLVIMTRKGMVSYMSAFAMGVTMCMFGCIPVRIVQSYVMYHEIFREGWWPIIWAISYTAVFISVLSWLSDRIWKRIIKNQ